ncbi:MAG: hypothetical protein K2X28_00615 [Alphaproteobacteria bacterium]|nr:hypothetical protein [Alphaproteobacteria bacterium]
MRSLSKIKYAFLFVSLFLSVNSVIAKDEILNKVIYSPSNLPKFKDFPSLEAYKGKVSPVDLKSYPEAYKYRTRLQDGVKAGPNFAGHYVVVTIGCGTNCQSQWIVDANNGKVLGKFFSSLGATYRIDSNLLILNPPTEGLKQKYKESPNAGFLKEETNYLSWEKGRLELIYKEPLSNLLKE